MAKDVDPGVDFTCAVMTGAADESFVAAMLGVRQAMAIAAVRYDAVFIWSRPLLFVCSALVSSVYVALR